MALRLDSILFDKPLVVLRLRFLFIFMIGVHGVCTYQQVISALQKADV